MLPEALPAVERHEVILRRGVSGFLLAVDRLEDFGSVGKLMALLNSGGLRASSRAKSGGKSGAMAAAE